MPTKNKEPLKPVCFMVMPFRTKKTTSRPGSKAPKEVDFDALWDRAFSPAIEEMGYIPIRADHDPGSLIVKDMLERLAFADLVLADVTLPSGNCYYEVGIRHVAQKTRCVLLAADWSEQLFDLAQFNTLQYDLKDGRVPPKKAEKLKEFIAREVPKLKEARTPYHETLLGPKEDIKRRGVFHESSRRLSEFQSKVRSIRLSPKSSRGKKIRALKDEIVPTALEIPEVAVELLTLIRDSLDWSETLSFVDSLPPSTRLLPFVQEQRLLAMANEGEPLEAIAELEELIDRYGDSPERRGLIGGRYKRLWRAALEERKKSGRKRPSTLEHRYLENAIEHYQTGMDLDLNQYYCSSNLPSLLRARGKKEDLERSVVIDHFVVTACERAIAMGEEDEWARQTLLGAAFRAGEVERAEGFSRRIQKEGPARWQLKSTLEDLAIAVSQTKDVGKKRKLSRIFKSLKSLMEDDST